MMPEGPKLEARMAESGARVLEEGAYQLGGLRESCERPQWGPEQSLGQEEFFFAFWVFRVSCPAVLLCKIVCAGPHNLMDLHTSHNSFKKI